MDKFGSEVHDGPSFKKRRLTTTEVTQLCEDNGLDASVTANRHKVSKNFGKDAEEQFRKSAKKQRSTVADKNDERPLVFLCITYVD